MIFIGKLMIFIGKLIGKIEALSIDWQSNS